VVQVGGAPRASRVPAPLRRGTFLAPQGVSAVDVSDNGRFVAVGTMAFRHDRNFFLLSTTDGGKVLWGRHVEPWAPSQVAALADGGDGEAVRFAAGMAFARQTEPFPVVSLFRGGQEKEVAAFDDVGWERGVMRYGAGDDWRTGWTASVLGDVFARGRDAVVTVPSHDGNSWRWAIPEAAAEGAAADGKPVRFALPR